MWMQQSEIISYWDTWFWISSSKCVKKTPPNTNTVVLMGLCVAVQDSTQVCRVSERVLRKQIEIPTTLRFIFRLAENYLPAQLVNNLLQHFEHHLPLVKRALKLNVVRECSPYCWTPSAREPRRITNPHPAQSEEAWALRYCPWLPVTNRPVNFSNDCRAAARKREPFIRLSGVMFFWKLRTVLIKSVSASLT